MKGVIPINKNGTPYSSGIVGEYNLEKSISKEMLWECKKRGLNRIMFNVQAADSVVYDAIMNTKGKYDLLIRSMTNAKECQIDTEIHFVPMKQNYNQIANVVKLAEQENNLVIEYALKAQDKNYFKIDLSNSCQYNNSDFKKRLEKLFAKSEYEKEVEIV